MCILFSFGLLWKVEANMANYGICNLDYVLKAKVNYKTYIWILADLKHNGELLKRLPMV